MPDNPQFLGALKPAEVAETINQSRGPSGENREYLLQLEEALKTLSDDSGDSHVSELTRMVRTKEPVQREHVNGQNEKVGLHRVSSTEEQEEIEKK